MLPENWDVLRAFLAAQTQWRHGPSGQVVGLDYASAEAAVRGVKADGFGDARAGRRLKWRRLFGGLRTMEAAVLAELAAREKRRLSSAGP